MVPRAKPKALMAWSSGKDSAWALHEIRKQDGYEIVGAITTVTSDANRVTVHGVPEDLLRVQLGAARLTPMLVNIPDPCPNEIYAQRMSGALNEAASAGVTHVVFGDLFLADLRAYREARLAEVGMTAVFPLWQRPTARLAREMIASGLRAHLATIDLKLLPESFASRTYDTGLLADLPDNVDPCGENGEFHSFATAGPMFAAPIPVHVGATISRDGFAYAGLTLA
jgi:uncharacterized protein (TIGR00290 family)